MSIILKALKDNKEKEAPEEKKVPAPAPSSPDKPVEKISPPPTLPPQGGGAKREAEPKVAGVVNEIQPKPQIFKKPPLEPKVPVSSPSPLIAQKPGMTSGFFHGESNNKKEKDIKTLKALEALELNPKGKKKLILLSALVFIIAVGVILWRTMYSGNEVATEAKEEIKAVATEEKSPEPPKVDITEDLQGATSAYNVGNMDLAITLFQQAISKQPGNAMLHSSLGLIYFKKGLFDNAASEYEKALSLDSNCAICLNNFGLLKSQIGENEEAQNYLEKAIAINSTLPDPYFNLAVMNEQLGDIGVAVKYYRLFLDTYPKKDDELITMVTERVKGLTGK